MFYKQECRFPKVVDTRDIQIESLYTFAGALGYEPVTNTKDELLCFYNPRAEAVGQGFVSVCTMIKKHNNLPGQCLRALQDGRKVSFAELVSSVKGEDMIVALFAGYTRIVRKLKLTYSKKTREIKVQSNKISFQTRHDAARAGEDFV